MCLLHGRTLIGDFGQDSIQQVADTSVTSTWFHLLAPRHSLTVS